MREFLKDLGFSVFMTFYIIDDLFKVLDELSVFYIKFNKIKRRFVLFTFQFKVPTL